MAVRPVLRLPEPVLKQVAAPVDGLDQEARALAVDLIDTMRASPACVGLAAPQIGVGRRAFVVDVTGHRKARSCHGQVVLFNPEVLLAHGPMVAREGCMSVPDLTGDVARATRLVVRGLTPEGTDRVLEVDAFEARAFLHELDHLDGLLFLDRVSSSDAVFRRKVYR
jgi:peptide deformylase